MGNPYELIGTVFGLLSVWFTVRKNIWCWPTGLVNIVLFFVMFYQARLYAELITYSAFFGLSVYGWWEWAYGGEDHDALPVTRTPRHVSFTLIGIGVIWSPLQGYGFHRYTDAALPYWDSAITVLSLLAQWMMARKYVENWILWIAVDVLGIGVYWFRGLQLTAALYAVFLVMAVCGLISWWRGLRTEGSPLAAA